MKPPALLLTFAFFTFADLLFRAQGGAAGSRPASTPTSGPASAPAESIALRRAREIAALVPKGTEIPADMFEPSLLAAAPIPRLRSILDSIQLGKITGVTTRWLENQYLGRFFIEYDSGVRVPLVVGTVMSDPWRIQSLWFGPPAKKITNLHELEAQLEAFPGRTGFIVAKFPADPARDLEILASAAPEEELAIGSAFKLYILGALIEDIAAGRRNWTDTTTLEENKKSFPSGILQNWPADAPITIHTLASLMISQSDNTATDHLLYLLGRERVESMLAPMGNLHANRNIPMLSTREMFQLKGRNQRDLRKKFTNANTTEKRQLLKTEVAAISRDDVDLSQMASKPLAIDKIEWFASPADLARAARWILDHTKTPATAAARGILGINLGADVPRPAFSFIGYKGGSETGVLNLTYLFETRDGSGYAVTATWNNSAAAVQTETLLAVVTSAIETIAEGTAK